MISLSAGLLRMASLTGGGFALQVRALQADQLPLDESVDAAQDTPTGLHTHSSPMGQLANR